MKVVPSGLSFPRIVNKHYSKAGIVIKPITGREVVERRVGDEVKLLDVVDVRVERQLLFRVGGS